MIKKLALAATWVAALALAAWGMSLPRDLPVNAPVQAFSAGRAMIDDRVIARTPHPIGSPANAVARDYLMHRMQTMGLSPRVQRAEALRDVSRSPEPYVLGGMVENVIGVLPGRNPSLPALVLMCHYDSVPGSPGAADDAAGVSAGLEVVRALQRRGPLERDVILLATDGEEAGLLGAEAFFRQDPAARRVGFVINMETRGGGGASQMFQTGADNGQLVDLFRRTAAGPTASSLTVFLYEHMPNDTDFTVSKAAGITGLNFAFIGRQFDYHSPTSTPDHLDRRSVQNMGEQVLPVALAVASSDVLPGRAPNAVYANTLGGRILAYPPAAGWIAPLLAAGLIGIGAWWARRRGSFAWTDVLRGLGAFAYLALTSAALLHLARRCTGAGFGFLEQRQLLAQAGRWEAALFLVAVGVTIYAAASAGRGSSRIHAALLALAAGAGASLFGVDLVFLGVGAAGAVVALVAFGKPAGVAGSWTGILIVPMIATIAAQVLAPQVAFLTGWPLVLAALAGALTAMGSLRSPLALAPPAVLGAVGLQWLLTFAHGVYLGLDMVELLAVFAVLGLIVTWPLAHGDADRDSGVYGLRNIALGVVLLGFVLTAVVRFAPPWSARYPLTTIVYYAVDQDTGRARRISPVSQLDRWTRTVLTADQGRIAQGALPILSRKPVWMADARIVPAAAPLITFAQGRNNARTLTFIPPPGAREFSIDLKSDTVVTGVLVDGRATRLLYRPGQWGHLRLSNLSQGLTVTFTPVGPGNLDLRYAATTEAWPDQAAPLPKRSRRVMPFDVSDSTFAHGTRRFTWAAETAR